MYNKPCKGTYFYRNILTIKVVEHLNFIKCTFLMLFLVVGELAHAMVVRIDHVDRRGEM